jgi:hypothetical protein
MFRVLGPHPGAHLIFGAGLNLDRSYQHTSSGKAWIQLVNPIKAERQFPMKPGAC